MRLVQNSSGTWNVLYNGEPIAIERRTVFETREDAVALIAQRGLAVTEDGEILRPAQTPVPEVPEEAPEVQETQEPAPVASVEPQTAPEETEEQIVVGVQETPKRRGRPRTFTPEEMAERRRQQNRAYYHRRKQETQKANAERARQWRQENPERLEEYKKRSRDKRRERYQNDPEYRARVAASNKAYQERRKAQKEAESSN